MASALGMQMLHLRGTGEGRSEVRSDGRIGVGGVGLERMRS